MVFNGLVMQPASFFNNKDEENMSIDIATITCPSCGADADSLCFYPCEAFCMNCGEVFDLSENARGSREIVKNSNN